LGAANRKEINISNEYIPQVYKRSKFSAHRLSDERVKQLDGALIALVNKEGTLSSIAARFNITRAEFVKMANRYIRKGLPVNKVELIELKHGREPGTYQHDGLKIRASQVHIDKIYELAAHGLGADKIAKEVPLGRATITRYLRSWRNQRYRSDRADPTEPYGGPHA
jgi:predicted transcriptional regulator